MLIKENVLIVGSGGRENSVAWKLTQSPRLGRLYVAPGNAGTALTASNVPIDVMDSAELLKFVQENDIHLTIVGPENPLGNDIVTLFRNAGRRIFGPTRRAAEIELSKAWAKQVMTEEGIRTASWWAFDDYATALAHLRDHGAPVVVKASGAALGKGAYICKALSEAEAALKAIMIDKVHKEAGDTVVIEDFLEGEEFSAHALTDGTHCKSFPFAQDHKREGDGDSGENTGGMGIVVPVPWVSPSLYDEANGIFDKTFAGLASRRRTFTGCLYPGLMLTVSGLAVLEYNARFGDPEAEGYMRLLKSDLLDLFDACVDGTLDECSIEWNEGFAVAITVASGGYPRAYEKGFEIFGIREAEEIPNVLVFHAGTAMKDGKLTTNGGRVLIVTATASTLEEALLWAYEAIKRIHFKGMHYRTDIGKRALARGYYKEK